MEREFPNNPWCRYADDAIIHCVSEKQAQYLKDRLEKRFRECKLEIHPDKTKIVYCKDSNRTEEKENIGFTFLGYTFKPRKAKTSISEEICGWRLLWRTQKSIDQIAEDINPVIRGWLNYYGRYGKMELARVLENISYHLMQWVQRKYKKCKHRPKKAYQYLMRIHDVNPKLCAHWEVGISPLTGS